MNTLKLSKLARGFALGAILLGGSAMSALADGTEDLGAPVGLAIAPGTDVVIAGTGMFSQPGTINIDVPAGANIQQVLLYWEGFAFNGSQDDTISVNGSDVTGTQIGGPNSLGRPAFTFRADITALGLVGPGINVLTVDGMDFGFASSPDGAAVLVIFDDGSPVADIALRDGNDYCYANINSADPELKVCQAETFAVTPAGAARTATLAMMFGAGEADRPDVIEITVDGVTQTLNNEISGADGTQFDTLNIPVDIPADATSLTVQVFSSESAPPLGTDPDSIVWSLVALSVPPGDTPFADGRMTGGGSVFTMDGVRVTRGFEIHCDLRDPNNIEVNWQGNSFHMDQLTSAICTEDPGIIQQPPPSAPFDTFVGEGTGRLRQGGTTDFDATIQFVFVDAGEPGTSDTASIIIRDGGGTVVLEVSGFLNRGNLQTHKD